MTTLLERTGHTREGWHQGITAIYEAGKAMLDAGQVPHAALIEWEDDLTAKQRAFLHAAVLPQVAEQVRVGEKGERYMPLVWKEYFRALLLPDRWPMRAIPRWDPKKCALVQPKRKTPHREKQSTEDLGIRAYSQFIDQVIAHAVTELRVEFVFREGEREAVRYQPPRGRRSSGKVQEGRKSAGDAGATQTREEATA